MKKHLSSILVAVALNFNAALLVHAQEFSVTSFPPVDAATAFQSMKNPVVPTIKYNKAGTPDAGFLQRHEKYVAMAKEKKPQLLFLGDSLTERWERPGAAEIFASNFGPYNAAAFGISGDCTQHLLWRVTNGELDGSPKVIVLLIGTNNSTLVEAEHMVKGVTKVVETIRAEAPASKIILVSLLPRGERPNGLREKVLKANHYIARLDDGTSVFFLDIAGKFLEPDETISKEVMSDFLHLTPKGYQIFADALKPRVDELMK
ncbi:MAG: GDSL-type esterase/lipase family protein [Verrucomicrobiales bacterium]|nr:GDSL-type esterase/lipase family protein [Verrucomicrobiales bacterium]